MVEQQPVEGGENLKKQVDNSSNKLQTPLTAALVVAILVILGMGWYIFDVRDDLSDYKCVSPEVISLQADEKAAVSLQEDRSGALDLSGTNPQVGAVVESVSKHILLPSGEITVATVNDADKLRENNPKAFKYAKNGDRLLISQDTIIIYNLEIDKVVDVAH